MRRSVSISVHQWFERISNLSDADAEQLGTRHWLNTAYDCGYVDDQRFEDWLARLKSVGSKLGKMISNPDSWTE